MSVDEAELWTARGTHAAAVLSLFGGIVFRVTVAPGVLARLDARSRDLTERRLAHAVWLSLLAAFVSAGLWFALEAAAISSSESLIDWAAARRPVLLETHCGRLLLLRCGLLLGTAIAFGAGRDGRRVTIAVLLAAGAVAAQAFFGHGAAMPGPAGVTVVVAEAVHVLAAGAWLGSLAPLFLVVSAEPSGTAAVASRLFSPLGIGCVVLLALSAATLA